MVQERSGLVAPGDVLKVERRLVVDGVVRRVTTRGTYKGIEVVGSAEHLILEDARGKTVRLVPLATVSEITLVKCAPRPPPAEAVAAPAPAWDPSVA